MKILLADDHDLFRAGLGMVLEQLGKDTVLVQASSLTDALKCAENEGELDLALLDLNMPGMDGTRGLSEFRKQFQDIPVVIVSGSDEVGDVHRVLNAGASGFIHKSTAPNILLSALRLVLEGGIYIPPHTMQQNHEVEVNAAPKPEAPKTTPLAGKGWENRLTVRQMEVLRLLAMGKPNKLIARELDLSEGTVKIHLSTIFRVLDVNNRTEAVLAAQQLSLDLGANAPNT